MDSALALRYTNAYTELSRPDSRRGLASCEETQATDLRICDEGEIRMRGEKTKCGGEKLRKWER